MAIRDRAGEQAEQQVGNRLQRGQQRGEAVGPQRRHRGRVEGADPAGVAAEQGQRLELGQRSRVATEQQIFARQALQRQGGAAEMVSAPDEWNELRQELEARAIEEARLTDSGERGAHRELSREEASRV